MNDEKVLVTDLSEEQQRAFREGMEALNPIITRSVLDFFNNLTKKIKRAAVKGRIDLPAPQNFWQSVGNVLTDFLMVTFKPLPHGSASLTSTKKGHLILAEFFTVGALWSCYCAGSDIEEIFEAIKEHISIKGADGRINFAAFFEAHRGLGNE